VHHVANRVLSVIALCKSLLQGCCCGPRTTAHMHRCSASSADTWQAHSKDTWRGEGHVELCLGRVHRSRWRQAVKPALLCGSPLMVASICWLLLLVHGLGSFIFLSIPSLLCESFMVPLSLIYTLSPCVCARSLHHGGSWRASRLGIAHPRRHAREAAQPFIKDRFWLPPSKSRWFYCSFFQILKIYRIITP
jgi:hypothetical protein